MLGIPIFILSHEIVRRPPENTLSDKRCGILTTQPLEMEGFVRRLD